MVSIEADSGGGTGSGQFSAVARARDLPAPRIAHRATRGKGLEMIDIADVQSAREQVREHVIQTPCAPSAAFTDLFDGQAWFKFENLQRTGSFKERGALNRMLRMTEEDRSRGVIAASAGNHAQGVAYHAFRLGIRATIVMPERTPLIKVTNTERFGAEVILHGNGYEEAISEALRIQGQGGQTLIHAFEDPYVIAGQGTIGLELLEQCADMDVVVVPVGGGGLIAGIAVAIKSLRPEVRIIGVEAEKLPAAVTSRDAGELVTVPAAETIADGIAVRRVGEQNFEVLERYVDDLVLVSEEEIAGAVLLLLEREKTVAEPAAATTLAAVVGGQIADLEQRNVVMLLSGGNIDANLLSRIIERGLVHDGRLVELVVRVPDRPGSLAGVTALLGEAGANILQLAHRRGSKRLQITEAEVELMLETRGRMHVQGIVSALENAGYQVHSGRVAGS
jgi:threonine dehydratase